MTTFKDTDLEALTEDLKEIPYSDNPHDLMNILLAKRSQKELDKLFELCNNYIYAYERVFGNPGE